MKWCIPAKTFFLGEYAALAKAPAIVLTTTPCFEVTLTDEPGLHGLHPESPAGLFWLQQGHNNGLLWHDPYGGCGGLGASSAQWLGAYYASHYLQKKSILIDDLLTQYFSSASLTTGTQPSGYDVWAQSQQECVYIHRQENVSQCYSWPFKELAFILLHTGKKLATHQHLQSLMLTEQIKQLSVIVESAKIAFETADSTQIINAVNVYHQCLLQLGFVADHSLELIATLQEHDDVLAIKGCGAMGADVLLVLVPSTQLENKCDYFAKQGLNVLASSAQLHLSLDK